MRYEQTSSNNNGRATRLRTIPKTRSLCDLSGRWRPVPDKLAIVTDEISLTYRALDLMASRIAAALVSLPSQRDRPIVLFMQDDAARIATMLGALKASRIFIPVAPGSPQKWLTEIIEDSGTAHIIVDSSTRSIAERAATGSVTCHRGRAARSDHWCHSWPIGLPLQMTRPISSILPGRLAGQRAWPISHRSLIRRGDVRYSLFGLGRNGRYANLRSSGVSSGVN